MKKINLWSLSGLLILCSVVAHAQTVDVLTQHNDLKRTGWNNQETILNTSNVKAGTFGKIFTANVDDKIYAQPLVVTGVSTPLGTKNVVYVGTVNNSLYAFDADNGATIWQKNFTPAGSRPPTSTDIHASLCSTYNDFSGGKFGIVGTPVIDKTSNTLYVVSRDADPNVIDNTFHADVTAYSSTGFFMRLHAIDIRDGSDKVAPVIITAQTASTAFNAVNGFISLDPRRNNQRGGLLLTGGIVYITFAAHCDWQNYNGWIVGYDATNLVQKISYSSTPNSAEGGIWMSGAAPAVDANGNIYVASGNGGANPAQLTDRGESVIKLTPDIPGGTLTVSDFFTPKDYQTLNSGDLDLPIQVMLIPGTNLVVTGCKDGNLYVMSSNNPPGLGGFNVGFDNLMQKILVQSGAQMHSSFAYFGGNTTKYFYQFSEGTALKAYPVLANSLSTTPVNGPTGPTGLAGAYMSVSSNGGDPATGVLWVNHAVSTCNANQNFCPGILRAFNAGDITKELWNSATNPNDAVDTFAKTICPTVANGKVYVGSNGKQSKLMVYGLAASDPCPGLSNVARKTNNPGAAYFQQINFADDPVNTAHAFDSIPGTVWDCPVDDVPNGTPAYLQVDLGKLYDVCSIVIYFGNSNTLNYVIEGSTDNTTYATLETVTNNGVPSHTLLLEGQSLRYIRFRPRNKADFLLHHLVDELQVFGEPTNACAKPTNVSFTSVDENDGTLNWQSVTGTGNDPTSYNIQYQVPLVSNWRTTTSGTNSVSLHALTCGADYSYSVQAVCPSGKSNFTNGTFATDACSVNCGTLTRYHHADVGEIGKAGSYCYTATVSDTTFTIKASGLDIGVNTDAFQYVFTNLGGDEEVTGRVLPFDAGSIASSKAGIMMRDSVLVGFASRFAFIGVTKANGVVFEYRSTPGGSTTTVNVSGLTPPYWIKLRKLGTQYSAFISPTGVANSFVQVGTTVNLGFGTAGSINVGPAATSTSNAILSTATVDQFHEGGGAPLPITLLSFSASNINNDHVLLRWATSMELNNDHFEIERSKDDGTQFEKISSVKAIGNSDVTQNYSAEDQNPVNGVNLYRLKQVDLDGKTSYSYVVPVNFGVQAEPLVYPNPANSYFTVVAGAEPVKEIELYNISGKLLQHINSNSNSSTRISLANLSSGIYIVQIKTASAVYQQKLSKQ